MNTLIRGKSPRQLSGKRDVIACGERPRKSCYVMVYVTTNTKRPGMQAMHVARDVTHQSDHNEFTSQANGTVQVKQATHKSAKLQRHVDIARKNLEGVYKLVGAIEPRHKNQNKESCWQGVGKNHESCEYLVIKSCSRGFASVESTNVSFAAHRIVSASPLLTSNPNFRTRP